MREMYSGLPRTILKYWRAYGGWKAFFLSFYLHCSLLMTFAFLPSICRSDINIAYWADLVFQITPSLLGFVLAGTAVFIGMRDTDFARLICGKIKNDKRPSPFIVTIASFTHFAVFQVLSLINAIFAKAYAMSNCRLHHIFTIWLFCYSMLHAIAAIFAVFTLAGWYDTMFDRKDVDYQPITYAANIYRPRQVTGKLPAS